MIKKSVLSFLIALGASAVLLAVFGYICYTREDPGVLFKPLGMTALYLSALTGGLVSARLNRSNTVLSSALTGLLFMLSVVVISFIIRPDSESIGITNWLLYFLIIVVSTVGGFVYRPSAKKRKKQRRRRK